MEETPKTEEIPKINRLERFTVQDSSAILIEEILQVAVPYLVEAARQAPPDTTIFITNTGDVSSASETVAVCTPNPEELKWMWDNLDPVRPHKTFSRIINEVLGELSKAHGLELFMWKSLYGGLCVLPYPQDI